MTPTCKKSLAGLFLVSFFAMACAPRSSVSDKPASSNSQAYLQRSAYLQQLSGDIRYFGFWGDALNGVGTGDYIQETASAANVHFIGVNSDYGITQAWSDKVSAARSKGNKSILMLESVLFQWASSNPHPYRASLMNNLKSVLAGQESSIVGIYLIDEPFWKNSLNTKPLSDDQVYANLADAAKFVKQHFPNAVVITTEAAPVVQSKNIQMPQEIDWIGVNCYAYYAECTTVEQLDGLYTRLKNALKSHQKMIFTLDGHWSSLTGIDASTGATRLVNRNKDILKLIPKYPTIALFPFIYQSHGPEGIIGTRDLPEPSDKSLIPLKTLLFGLGGRIKGCTSLNPSCEGKDYVRRDSCGNEIERWKNAPAPYCQVQPIPNPTPTQTQAPAPNCVSQTPRCEGRNYVRRDSCGREIERWKNAPAPYCPCVNLEPKCEGRDYVRRDTCGKVIERWVNAPAPYCR